MIIFQETKKEHMSTQLIHSTIGMELSAWHYIPVAGVKKVGCLDSAVVKEEDSLMGRFSISLWLMDMLDLDINWSIWSFYEKLMGFFGGIFGCKTKMGGTVA